MTDNGGKILMGPMEVPGGAWVVHVHGSARRDFALVGSRG